MYVCVWDQKNEISCSWGDAANLFGTDVLGVIFGRHYQKKKKKNSIFRCQCTIYVCTVLPACWNSWLVVDICDVVISERVIV